MLFKEKLALLHFHCFTPWSGMCTQHDLWQNYFPQLLLLSKWGKVISSDQQLSATLLKVAEILLSAIWNTGWAPTPTEVLNHFQGLWKLSSGWEARSENICGEIHKRSSEDRAFEDITNDSRVGTRRRVWLKYWKSWQGSDQHPRQSCPSPEVHSPHQNASPQRLWHSPRCTLSHRMWPAAQQLPPWHSTK